jgi:YHS domain-containing protein
MRELKIRPTKEQLKNKEQDELRQKAKRWEDVKTQYRQNEDGTRSSHKMAYSTTDNGAIAYPTIFPKERQGTESHNPNDWIELKGKEAIDTAKARGEVYYFKSEENAAKWSEGEYKKNF